MCVWVSVVREGMYRLGIQYHGVFILYSGVMLYNGVFMLHPRAQHVIHTKQRVVLPHAHPYLDVCDVQQPSPQQACFGYDIKFIHQCNAYHRTIHYASE